MFNSLFISTTGEAQNSHNNISLPLNSAMTSRLDIINKNIEEEDKIEQVFERGQKRKRYENFSKADIEALNSLFSKKLYPKISDFDQLSKEIHQSSKKIQNWFKYKRRLAVLENEDQIPDYKPKKVLSPKIFEILKEEFKKNQNPTIKDYKELAKHTNLKEKQIISWFTYRRRKLKISKIEKENIMKLKKVNNSRVVNMYSGPIGNNIIDLSQQMLNENLQRWSMSNIIINGIFNSLLTFNTSFNDWIQQYQRNPVCSPNQVHYNGINNIQRFNSFPFGNRFSNAGINNNLLFQQNFINAGETSKFQTKIE